MAANITLRMNGNASARRVTNAEWARILAYYQRIFSTQAPGQPPVVPTEVEVVDRLATSFVNSILDQVISDERKTAAQTARNAIAAIVPTTDVVV